MKRTRLVAALVAGTVVAGGLTACSSGTSDSSGPITISVMEYQQAHIDTITKLLPGFEAEMKKQGKNIKVKLVGDPLTDDQFKTKITQQLIAGQAPDLIDIGDSLVPGFAGAGYLAPLDDDLAKWDGWDHTFEQFKKASVRQDGKIYALVHDTGVFNLFYRKDVLTKLGVDTTQPATWDDLLARLTAIKDKTGNPALVLPAGTSWGGGGWGEGFQQILSGTDTSYYSTETGKWDLNSPGWASVFDLYYKLYAGGLLPVKDLQNPNPWQATKYVGFPEGKYPVSTQGTWGWKFDWGPNGQAPIADLENKVDTWQFPALKSGDTPFGWSGLGWSWVIPAKSKNHDAAVLLAEYLSSGEPVAQQLVDYGAAPTRDDIADVKPFSDEPKLVQASKDLASSLYVPTGDGADKISQSIATATELIISGKANGAEAYASFVKDASDLLGPDLVK
jgi:multiple sugar transport system substrate-binding protein